MSEKIQQQATLPIEAKGGRLDQALTKLFPDFSRTMLQTWLKQGEILVDGKPAKARDKVKGGETITLCAVMKEQPAFEAQAIQLDILFEDGSILVINKPAGMVVHPAAGNPNKTLLNALLYHAPSLQALPRAGIVHRLDKDTSGILIIAKTLAALRHLTKQIKAHSMVRIYQAIVSGLLISGGTIDAPIGRHPVQRKRMAVREEGKPAITHYRVIERYRAHTRIKVQLETGRTHQIRVHMAHRQHPLLGDPTYAGRLQIPKGASPALTEQLRQFKRQALHAIELSIVHPVTEQKMTWTAPLPNDLQVLIEILQKDR